MVQAIDQDSGNYSLIDYSMRAQPVTSDQADGPAADSFAIDAATGIIKTTVELAAEPRIFTYLVFGRESLGPPQNVANTSVTVSLCSFLFIGRSRNPFLGMGQN